MAIRTEDHAYDYYENGVLIKRKIITKTFRDFICKDCKYLWETKKKVGDPAKCPKCNSKNITGDTDKYIKEDISKKPHPLTPLFEP